MGRFILTNLGPANYYCVERGKLLRPNDSVELDLIDEGTALWARAPKPRLKIVDRQRMPDPEPPSPPPAPPAAKQDAAPVEVVEALDAPPVLFTAADQLPPFAEVEKHAAADALTPVERPGRKRGV